MHASQIVLLLLVGVASVTDTTRGRIYNWTTYPGLLAGLLFQSLDVSNAGHLEFNATGLTESLLGVAGCGGIMLACFLLSDMGGGDVKLLGALALWIPFDRLPALVVMMAIIGWLLTMGMAAWRVRASSGSGLSRDMLVLIGCFLCAFAIGAVLLGGAALPSALLDWSAESLAATLAIAVAPSLLLLVATLVSLRVIKRHARRIQVPYGLAIASAGLWIIATDLAAGSGGTPLAG